MVGFAALMARRGIWPQEFAHLREIARWGHTALFVVEPRTANHLLQLAEGLPVVQIALRPQHLELAVEVVPQDFNDLAVRGFYCSRAEVKNHDTEDDGNRAQEQDRAVEAVPALAAGGTGAEDRYDAEGGNHRADHHHPNREPWYGRARGERRCGSQRSRQVQWGLLRTHGRRPCRLVGCPAA